MIFQIKRVALIKKSINYILYPLTHIVNISLSTGVVPCHLKIAKVIPIHKNGETDLIKNYRPISILPSFSKIIEKIVYTRTVSFLQKHNILTNYQFGF